MSKKALVIVVVFGVAFMITIVILVLTGPHMKNQASLHAFDAEMQTPPDYIVFFDHDQFDTSKLVLPKPTATNLEKGEIYYSYYCLFCHGESGDGNGPVGQSYLPKPSDLNTNEVKHYTPAELYSACFTGTGHSPVLERVIPQQQRKFILAYIHHGIDR